MTHPHPKRSFVPKAVLTRSGKLSTAGVVVNTVRPVNTANTKAVNTVRPVNTANTKAVNTVKPVNTANTKAVNNVRSINNAASKPIINHPKTKTNAFKRGYSQRNPQQKEYKEKAVIDNGYSKHMTGNTCYLDKYEYYDGRFISFGDGKGRISGKGKIKTGSLDFDDNNVLFTDTECLVVSSDFKLLDESQVLLRVLRKDNIYSVDLKSVVPTGGLTCLIAKAIIYESNTWHRRLGHINFKIMNKLEKGNLIKGLPSKIFKNDHSCVACQKGKQHKASYKTKLVNSISKPLHMLHMDLFGPTNVKSLMKKSYFLVVTDDFRIENQLDHKVKVIRCDNGTEFKNSIMNQFCEIKGIKREFSVARTPQQNGVAERKNKTLIEAARTMDHLGKFDGKADEGYFVRYYVVSKAMRVFNKRNMIVEETLNIRFLENAPNVKGNGPDLIFDVNSLTISMNYVPVVTRNETNGIAGNKDNIVAGQAEKKKEPEQEYILIPLCITDPLISQDPKNSKENAGKKPTEKDEGGASDNDI
ncbi:putative ribonuclease H-like domain-containing protein [Tanacetum coccineum]